ncbi:TIM-barrel protein, nifR3 family [Methylocella silvestris BL2]|uniref:tRNA-dihydrouridine synthase n=1 Tax=Methylocella silvestris (strain DSM 15510 / CIP 108128 / LMG 27833 / NCIMB 13906 / BL2) TaxID=395965 RepID=B8EJU5_METSB|nr:TIM-barrel protein, nifR3 family [Methylocella silvestris BL2]
MRIGSVALPGCAFLAPMSGVTDIAMRRVAQRFGASLVFTEMVAAEAYAKGDAENRLKAEGRGVDPHVVQIAGCDAQSMARAARIAADSGAAILDINMGCPAKKVINGYSGSHLMRDLPLALDLIRATVRAVDIPVTLKMRLGWDEASINAAELGRLAEAEGIAMLTVHGRTRSQFYNGKADWRAIRAVKEAVSIPVVANGDCASLADAARMMDVSGADAVMIGRAAIGQPWLVGMIAERLATGVVGAEPSPAEKSEAAQEHYDGVLRLFGREQGMRHARKHLAAYAERSGSPAAGALRARLVTADDPETVRSILSELFDFPLRAEAA